MTISSMARGRTQTQARTSSQGTAPVPGRTDDRSWAARGSCVDLDPDGFFVQGAEQHTIKAACAHCPVRTACLADALDNRIDFGVWGGMTERERRRLLRRHPDVQDWSALLHRVSAQAANG